MSTPSREIFSNRISSLRNEMQQRKLDAFISSFSPTLRYLCGYSGSNGLLIVDRDSIFFLTDFRYHEIVQIEVAADEKIIGSGSLTQVAAKRKIFSPYKRVGFEKEHVSLASFGLFKKYLPRKSLAATAGIVEQLRTVKDQSEIATLQRAFDISDAVFRSVLDIIKPGMRELELSAEISYLHKKFGAENDSFDVIVASGVRGSLPHGTATGKKIQKGEFVTLDFGCVVEGYHSDMTRTICVGKPTAEMKKVYQVVLDAQQKGVDAVRDGVKAKKLDSIARNHIAKKGYGKYFGHSLGHGVGLEIHEFPRIAPKSGETIRTGNIITIEPGVYIPKQFGVRIEDTVAVRRNGCEVLTRSPKKLITIE